MRARRPAVRAANCQRAREGALGRLERRIGHAFADHGLLETALTHRSFSAEHNERLEFLGDAVLGHIVAQRLYDASDEREDRLTLMRAHVVQRDALAEVAREIGLGDFLRLGGGDSARQRASVLANALEAVIGAVACDGGTAAAGRVVDRLFCARLLRVSHADLKDPKTRLQEHMQGRGLALPSYRVVAQRGGDHEPIFEVECAVAVPELAARGEGRTRREAEKEAAARLVEAIGESQ
ncbi:MAG: ribonuclease III [Gammaproteobacteria bacterium]|nr:ribonuclease III [Gammaproteobacteria bacterium]